MFFLRDEITAKPTPGGTKRDETQHIEEAALLVRRYILPPARTTFLDRGHLGRGREAMEGCRVIVGWIQAAGCSKQWQSLDVD